MSKINLDNLFGNNDPKPNKAAEPEQKPVAQVTGDLGLVFVGASKGGKKGTGPVAPPSNRSMATIYQESQKLIYLIDKSGSMQGALAGSQQVAHFLWTEEVLKRIADAVTEALLRREAAEVVAEWQSDPDNIEEPSADTKSKAEEYTYTHEGDGKWAQLEGLEGEELKTTLLRLNLQTSIYLPKDHSNPNVNHELTTKIGLVKSMAKKMVHQRHEKYPDASIEAVAFNSEPHALAAGTTAQLETSIGQIDCTGGTNITGAVQFAMAICKRRPSDVNLHHFVLVTDGEDWGATQLIDLIPDMKTLGVVLDFIFIAQPGDTVESQEGAKAIKVVCDALGGTFTIVTTAEEFETKFVEASVRALLPPPTK